MRTEQQSSGILLLFFLCIICPSLRERSTNIGETQNNLLYYFHHNLTFPFNSYGLDSGVFACIMLSSTKSVYYNSPYAAFYLPISLMSIPSGNFHQGSGHDKSLHLSLSLHTPSYAAFYHNLYPS